MLCTTCTPDWMLVPCPYPTGMGTFYQKHPHPQPEDGIAVSISIFKERDPFLSIGRDSRILISRKFMEISALNVVRVEKKAEIRINRATVVYRHDKGYFELVPELKDDTLGTLILLDVGPARSQRVQYELDPASVVIRALAGWDLFHPATDILLAKLMPGATIAVTRSSRAYVFFGQYIDDERITYSLEKGKVTFEATALRPEQ